MQSASSTSTNADIIKTEPCQKIIETATFGLPSYQAVFEVSQAYYHYIYHGNTNLIADLKDAFKQEYVISRQGLNERDNKGYAVLHYFINFGHLLLIRQAPEEVMKRLVGWFQVKC